MTTAGLADNRGQFRRPGAFLHGPEHASLIAGQGQQDAGGIDAPLLQAVRVGIAEILPWIGSATAPQDRPLSLMAGHHRHAGQNAQRGRRVEIGLRAQLDDLARPGAGQVRPVFRAGLARVAGLGRIKGRQTLAQGAEREGFRTGGRHHVLILFSQNEGVKRRYRRVTGRKTTFCLPLDTGHDGSAEAVPGKAPGAGEMM